MESESPRSHGQHFEDGYPKPVSVEDQPQQEKRSMLGRMKDKARKMKNTLKSYGQGNNDHDDQHPLIEEDADDHNDDNVQEDEIVENPKIHNAPVYDSTTVVATPPTVESALGVKKGDMEKLPVLKEDHNASITQEPPIKFEDEKFKVKSDDEQLPISTANVEGRGGDLSGNVGRREEEDANAPKKDQLFDAPSNYETEVADSTVHDSTNVVAFQAPPTVESDLKVNEGDLEKLSVLKEDQYEPVKSEDEISRGISDDKHVPISTGIYNEPDNEGEISGANVEGRGGDLSGNVGRREEEDTNAPKKNQILDVPSNYETKVVDSTGTGIYGESQNKPNLGANQQIDSTFRSSDELSPGIYDGSQDEPNLGASQQTDSTFGSQGALSPRIHDGSQIKPNLGENQQIDSTFGSHDAISPGIYDGSQNKPNLEANQKIDSTFESQDALSPGIYDRSRNNPNLGTDSTIGSHDALSPKISNEPENSPKLESKENFGSTIGSPDQFSPGIYDESRTNVELNPKPNHDSVGHNPDKISSKSCKELLNNLNLGTNQNLDSTTENFNQLSVEPESTLESINSFDTENSLDDLSSYSGMTFSTDLPATKEPISTENSVDSARGYDKPNTEKVISTNTITAESFDSKYPIVDPHHESETETPSSPKLAPVSPNEKSEASSVKEYLTENSKPSEDDETRSNVILDPISTNNSVKDDDAKSGTPEIVTESVHKPETPEIVTDSVHKPELEKTETVSSEAEKDGGGGSGVATGMMNMIRGQYNSWMGNANPEQSSPGTAGGESKQNRAEDEHAKTAIKNY